MNKENFGVSVSLSKDGRKLGIGTSMTNMGDGRATLYDVNTGKIIKSVIGKPIKFLGMGEDYKNLEEFRPDGLASRILGMGDVVGLMDDFKKVADDEAEQDAEKMLSGQFSSRNASNLICAPTDDSSSL